jgi:hypothetical protein
MIAVFHVLREHQDGGLARVLFDLVEERGQLALQGGLGRRLGATARIDGERDRRGQQRCLARDHRDEIGRLLVAGRAQVVDMDRADLKPGGAGLFEAIGKGLVAAAGAFAGGHVDEIGTIAAQQAPVDRRIVDIGPGTLDGEGPGIGAPDMAFPPQQARADQRRQQQPCQHAPKRLVPASGHKRERAPDPDCGKRAP